MLFVVKIKGWGWYVNIYVYVISYGMVFFSYGLCNEFEKFLIYDLFVFIGYILDIIRYIK